jgi:hypothetical protein
MDNRRLEILEIERRDLADGVDPSRRAQPKGTPRSHLRLPQKDYY